VQYIKKENPTEKEINIVRHGLRAYNRQYWGNTKNNPYLIKIQAEQGSVIGGAFFYVFGNWLEVEYVWIEETYRNKGIGKRLLKEVESIAKQEGCKKGCLNTFDFQARVFYEKQGYKIVYTQEQIPKENTRYYMEKELI
jgi:GNAT superfamily N-acetyltransferase